MPSDTNVNEIAEGIYRISTLLPEDVVPGGSPSTSTSWSTTSRCSSTRVPAGSFRGCGRRSRASCRRRPIARRGRSSHTRTLLYGDLFTQGGNGCRRSPRPGRRRQADPRAGRLDRAV